MFREFDMEKNYAEEVHSTHYYKSLAISFMLDRVNFSVIKIFMTKFA